MVSIFGRMFRDKLDESSDEDALNQRVREMLQPFVSMNSHEDRVAALPVYVERQNMLAAGLAHDLNIDATRDWEKAIGRAWNHFLSTRKLVPYRRKKRGPRSANPLNDKYRYDLGTLGTIEKLAALFAVGLQQTLPNLRWAVGHDPEGKYLEEGRPVLTGFPGNIPEMQPAQVIMNIASRTKGSDDPELLRKIFQRWVSGGE